MQGMKCDVAVIGGGVIGLACAWRLAQGGAKVMLFERGTVGREASWAAAGMLAPLVEAARHPPKEPAARAAMLDLCLRSRDLYPSFADELRDATGIDVELQLAGFKRDGEKHHGIVYVASAEDDPVPNSLSAMDGYLHPPTAARCESALSLQRLTGKVALTPASEQHLWLGERLVPCPAHWEQWASEGRILWMESEGQVDNRLLVESLKRAAKESGVQIHASSSVHELAAIENRIVTLNAGMHTIECDKVLLCSGAWSGLLGDLPPDCLPPVSPVKGEIIELEAGSWALEQVVYASNVYLVPRASGSLLVGATMDRRKDFGKQVTAKGVFQLLENLSHLWPQLLNYPIKSTWAGLRPATPDGLPILGRTPLENLFVATGHFRNGILLTPITAQLMADCILNGQEPPREFNIARFHT